tara:strand:- start:491 stop:700 length:210 start_codon:yes stop_codon:yes gene_type:complete
MAIEIGDLVRVRGKEWIGKPLGIVTEVKDLIHDPSREEYTTVTALVAGQYFTFSEEDFELVGKAERKKK